MAFYLFACHRIVVVRFFLPNIAVLTYNDIAASVISQGIEDIASKIVTLRLQTSLLQVVSYVVLFFRRKRCILFASPICMGCSDANLFGLMARG